MTKNGLSELLYIMANVQQRKTRLQLVMLHRDPMLCAFAQRIWAMKQMEILKSAIDITGIKNFVSEIAS